jgi:hypothetical protein
MLRKTSLVLSLAQSQLLSGFPGNAIEWPRQTGEILQRFVWLGTKHPERFGDVAIPGEAAPRPIAYQQACHETEVAHAPYEMM